MGVIGGGAEANKTGGEGYGYTEDEWIFKMNLREFCEKEMKPRWKELYDPATQDAAYHEFLKKLGDMDVFRVFVPEQLGGIGMRFTTMMLCVEEVSRVCGGLGIHTMMQGMNVKAMAGIVPASFKKWGAGILSGDILCAGASCSPEGQSNYAEQACIGTFDEATDEWVLNGVKQYSSGGAMCDLLRIMGMVDGTTYHWYLTPDTPGLSRTANVELGCSPSASWEMRDVRIPKEMGGLCPSVQNRTIVSTGYDAFAMSVAAMALGAMSAAMDETIEYLTNRTHDFKPVASISAVQYKFGVMSARVEACRSFVIKATDLCEAGHVDAVKYSRMVKGFVCDTARDICNECIQMWGNVGYDSETGIARHLWDAIGLGIGCGTSDLHYREVAYDMGLPGAPRILP